MSTYQLFFQLPDQANQLSQPINDDYKYNTGSLAGKGV